MKRIHITAAAGAFTALFATAGHAQQVAVEAGLSTLGPYVAPSYAVTDDIHVRVPLYFGSASADFEDSGGTDIEASASLSAVTVLADYYPTDTNFRLSAGLSFGGYEFTADAANPEIDGTVYNANISATLEQSNTTAVVLAAGYTFTITDNFGITAEAGARLTGLELSTTGQENLNANDRAQYDADIAEINEDLDISAIPYVSLGLTVVF